MLLLDDSELCCAICKKQLEEPKQIPCCHTFCLSCLEKLVRQQFLSDGRFEFTCPVSTCRSPTEVHSQSRVFVCIVTYISNNPSCDSKRETKLNQFQLYYITRALPLSRGSGQWGRVTVTGAQSKWNRMSVQPLYRDFGRKLSCIKHKTDTSPI